MIYLHIGQIGKTMHKLTHSISYTNLTIILNKLNKTFYIYRAAMAEKQNCKIRFYSKFFHSKFNKQLK